MGFTLKAALAALPPDAVVVTAEILPAVVAWNRNPAFHLASAALADARVTIVMRDVFDVIAASAGHYDSIILDVDNGPAALTSEGNARLYSERGLRMARAALRPAGRVAFWSAAPNAPFERLLASAGFVVRVHRCRSHPKAGPWHTLFVCEG